MNIHVSSAPSISERQICDFARNTFVVDILWATFRDELKACADMGLSAADAIEKTARYMDALDNAVDDAQIAGRKLQASH
ncbi:hypothetical protein ATN84_10850 [Paramesorhizobium deserti]|uniref:Uncharacterized protein n=1 Tax=Paramesorhizobium deserti TaxID=1494590 RepID=A0A135HTP7_9HYPH|nr:hypothetical protein [Paramesorhizobium deserti]KXF76553.1 hypothetical protein ATN84_10850 [Paramesorhizobium deserti]